jgi:hypothetical protein
MEISAIAPSTLRGHTAGRIDGPGAVSKLAGRREIICQTAVDSPGG